MIKTWKFSICWSFQFKSSPLIKKKKNNKKEKINKKERKNEKIKILPLEMSLATCQAGGHAALHHSPHQA